MAVADAVTFVEAAETVAAEVGEVISRVAVATAAAATRGSEEAETVVTAAAGTVVAVEEEIVVDTKAVEVDLSRWRSAGHHNKVASSYETCLGMHVVLC